MFAKHTPQLLYLAQEDLYRLGTSTSPKVDNVRIDTTRKRWDVDTYEMNGVIFVRANGKGVSLLTEDVASRQVDAWLWKLPAGVAVPTGLVLNHDTPTHFSLCPESDMPVDAYRGLLAGFAVKFERIRKL